MNLDQKKELTKGLEERFSSSCASFFITYQGTSCKSLGDFRVKLKESGSTFSVVKNTLARRSLGEDKASELKPALTGPTGVVFAGEDPAASAKAIADFAKESEFVSVKAGILEGDVISSDAVEQLAKLPSKEELFAKLLSVINAPATKLLQTINEPGSQVVRTLAAVKAKLEE